MGAMYRLKAYFGMVPADELDDYEDEPAPANYRESRRGDRWAERYDDEPADNDYPAGRDDSNGRHEPSGPQVPVGRNDSAAHDGDDDYDDSWPRRGREPIRPVGAGRSAAGWAAAGGASGLGPGAVRGALAVDPDAVAGYVPERPQPTAIPEQPRERAPSGQAGLARIITLQPSSYNEARTIGERYRDGVPVIMNLTELDDAAAKRLVDFAAGLAFALRGSIDKVTNRVFLLTPPDVEVSADDARAIAKRRMSHDG